VIVSARSQAPLTAFVAGHPGAEACPLDAIDRAAVQAAADQLLQRHGRLDFVWFGAAVYQPMRAAEFDLDRALEHLAVNVGAALHVVGAVLPRLRAQAAAGRPT
jgi:NAD(P)-dependent dehydrogenase (short-subunit alcohol dehydrogenase family)